jgi:hypothetical protein
MTTSYSVVSREGQVSDLSMTHMRCGSRVGWERPARAVDRTL